MALVHHKKTPIHPKCSISIGTMVGILTLHGHLKGMAENTKWNHCIYCGYSIGGYGCRDTVIGGG